MGTLVLATASPVTEYVGFAPCGTADMPSKGESVLKWMELTYEPTVSSAKGVTFQWLTETVPEIGALWNLDLSEGGGSGAALSAKLLGDTMYMYVDKKTAAGGGCCADTLRMYDRLTGTFTELDLDAIMTSTFADKNSTFHEATHTFDVQEEDGVVYAWLMTQYLDSSLGSVKANAIVCIDTRDGSVRKTRDGDAYFSMLDKLGTTSVARADTVYRVQYTKKTTGAEQWHGNGMLRFSTRHGEPLIAFTHRFMAEAVLITDPWATAAAAGGGAIVQRFGTPAFFNGSVADDDEAGAEGTDAAGYHFFGVKPGIRPWIGGVHNVHYRAVSTSAALLGNETLSLFVNSIEGGNKSYVYEFAINPRPAASAGHAYDDSTFETPFVYAACQFEAMAQGGARAFGDGVFIVASGAGAGGVMEVVDQAGAVQDLTYPSAAGDTANVAIYDPFLFATKQAA